MDTDRRLERLPLPLGRMAAAITAALLFGSVGPAWTAEQESAMKPQTKVTSERLEPVRSDTTVTLQELLSEALKANPALQAALRRHVAAQAVPSQARSLPDPMVTGGLRNVGFDRLTTVGKEVRSDAILSVQQAIPFPKKLSLRGQVAEREADRIGSLSDVMERRLVRQVSVAYHDLFFIHKSIEIIEKDKDLRERFARTAEARYSVGKGIQQDVFRAQVAVSRLLDRLSVLRQQERSARARLNMLLNRPPESTLGRPLEVPVGTLAFTQAELESKALEASPAVAAARWEVDRSHAKLKLAKAQYYPDFNLKAAWLSRERFTDIWEAWFGFTVPLYSGTKQRYGVKEAKAALEAAEAQLKAARDEVLFTVADQYARAQTADEVSTLFRTGIIPQARLSLESAMSGYGVGAVDFLTLLDNVKELLDDELEYYRKVTNFHKSVARLEEVVGELVTKQP